MNRGLIVLVALAGAIGMFVERGAVKTLPYPVAPLDLTGHQGMSTKSADRLHAARAAVAAITKGLNDPASLAWDDLSADADGGVVCATFRARNAFNGMARKHVVYFLGSLDDHAETWNSMCAGKKNMFDEKDAFAF